MAKYTKRGAFLLAGLFSVGSAIWLLNSGETGISPDGELIHASAKEETEAPDTALPSCAAIAEARPSDAIRLAKLRGEQMTELIRTDPELAIRESLSLAEWNSLPENVREYVDQPFSAVADVEVFIACGEKSGTFVQSELPGIGKMETYVYGRRGEVDSKVGIPVQGIRVGNVGALRERVFQSLEDADEAAARILYPIAVEKQGAASVATLAGGHVFYFESAEAVDKANRKLEELESLPGPQAGAQQLFQSLEAYLEPDGGIDFQALEEVAMAASASWTGTPRDMYVILVDFSDLPGQPTDPVALSNSINTTVSGQIRDMSYEKTHIVATVNPTTYRMADVSTGYVDTLSSYPNAYRMYSNATALVEADGVDLEPYETVCIFFDDIAGVTYSGLANIGGKRMWINGTTSTKTITHELGHNYGARHADFWQSTSDNPVDPAGSEIGYGDFTDIMGSGSLPAGHFNAWHKKRINWFDAEHWQPVTNSGTYRVYRSDHRQTSGLLRGIEIQKGGGDQYWVGLRQEMDDYETFSRGAYVLWKMAGDNESDLLDMTPASGDGKYDGGLALGQTYSDAAAGVHITPSKRGGQTPDQWIDLTVNLGSFPGNTTPSAALSGPALLGINESTVFTVTAADADGDDLAYYWDIGDGLVKPNTPTLPVAWLSGGTATVSCVVSDMKGGTNKVTQSVVLSSPLENWTQRVSGTVENLNDIVVGDGRLVAVGDKWKTYYSDDGITWNSLLKYNIYLEGVIYDGAQFVAAGRDYAAGWKGAVFTSDDGTSWTRQYIAGYYLNDVAYGDGVYVAVGDNGTMIRSTDGTNWSPNASGTAIDLQSISYGAGTFVAVGDASAGGSNPHVVLTSTSGSNWTDRTSGTSLSLGNWLFDVQYCNDRFLAGGWGAEILSSTNLAVSFAATVSGSLNMEAFAYGNGIYFAAGRDIAAGNQDLNMISADGVNWVRLSTANQDDRNATVFYNGTFITVGNNGAIWQSDQVVASAGGFAAWQIENQAALGFDRDPLDDADFDGHVNLEEYAMGTSALDGGSMPVESATVDYGTYLQVSYDREGTKGDVDYTVERGVNLASSDWNAAGTVVLVDDETNLTVRSAYTLSSQSNEFMRLKLELK